MESVLREEKSLWWEGFVQQAGFKPVNEKVREIRIKRVVTQERKK